MLNFFNIFNNLHSHSLSEEKIHKVFVVCVLMIHCLSHHYTIVISILVYFKTDSYLCAHVEYKRLGGGFKFHEELISFFTSVCNSLVFPLHVLGTHVLGTHVLGTHVLGTHNLGTHVLGTHVLGTHVLGTHILITDRKISVV